jgi:hypothetical protein
MLTALSIAALLATGLFGGAALYIQAVVFPVQKRSDARAALVHWRESYPRATVMQVSLAVIAFLAAVGVWQILGDARWLAGGLLQIAVVPYTLIFVMPTNRRLSSPTLSDDEIAGLLAAWNRLHAVRTALSVAALTVMAHGAISAPLP